MTPNAVNDLVWEVVKYGALAGAVFWARSILFTLKELKSEISAIRGEMATANTTLAVHAAEIAHLKENHK